MTSTTRAAGPPGQRDKRGVSVRRHHRRVTRRTGSGIALLADDTRRTIVALIALRPRHPTELSRELGLSLPAISRQLGLLRNAGLIQVARSRVDARGRVYRLDPGQHGRIIAWLAGTDVALEESILSRWARAGAEPD
jgi:DNA-binding transcriptional ArsR family regulator